jgi:hypothetical protein
MQVSGSFGTKEDRVYDIDIGATYPDDPPSSQSSKQRGDIGNAVATALDDFLSAELAEGRTAASEMTIKLRAQADSAA